MWASVVLAATIWACVRIIRAKHERPWVWPARWTLLAVVALGLWSQWPTESKVTIGGADAAAGRPIAWQTHELAGVAWYDYDPGLLDRGRSGAGSTGLGLDIARRTAEASGGGLEVTAGSGGRGLRVVVTFGAF